MSLKVWKQKGEIYLWYFEENSKNYPGWHLCANRNGAKSVVELISLLELEQSDAKITIAVTPPTSEVLSIPNCNGRAASLNRLAIFYEQSAPEFIISIDGQRVNLVLNRQWLKNLKKGVNDILNGKGDYSIGYGKNRVWFWWCV